MTDVVSSCHFRNMPKYFWVGTRKNNFRHFLVDTTLKFANLKSHTEMKTLQEILIHIGEFDRRGVPVA